ncbi:recombinase family protein [Microcoleus sp. LEGE 07076]|uniref:recombinase family protein n=1 Tax=Microcoleus sp. LEGE 07076 TaxID=915322 RepID=UPI001882C9E5|nr:recombinase family protein [Microcoleus sp. LEGE 07076]MBE9186098.1 recombinase family protein [Microcoleus sp. LEGE 07076]
MLTNLDKLGTPTQNSIWIVGAARSGKTARLVEQFCIWSKTVKSLAATRSSRGRSGRWRAGQTAPAILVLAANGENRLELADRIGVSTQGKYAFHSTTPFGFFEQEVLLFWPLLVQSMDLRAQFPLRLQPETELELAARVWRRELDEGILQQTGVSPNRMVRRTLDLLQLAAVSGTPREEIKSILEQGFAWEGGSNSLWTSMGELLERWREWCLRRGLLTYGIVCELYWRYLLPNPTYQQQLASRYQAVIADDVDDYPAICRDLFDRMLDRGAAGAFSYNRDGGVRLGLGADTEYLAKLESRCQSVENLDAKAGLAPEIGELVVSLAVNTEGFYPLGLTLPGSVRSLETTSRAQLLRETAEIIVDAVKSEAVEPQEIAVIAPGMDAIARYSLTEILARSGIATESLNDQRPLSTTPEIRALLTLLALVYPGLGRLVDRDAVAEMLVILGSQKHREAMETEDSQPNFHFKSQIPNPKSIDPVRACLIADSCFCPNVDRPQLLAITTFPRWDRLGHRAARAYEQIVEWIEQQRSQQQERLLPSPIALLDRAIQKFLIDDRYLAGDRLAALRELMETAAHYWEIHGRMQRVEPTNGGDSETIARFIQLLRQGTVTANPFPVGLEGPAARAVTLANIFQYRSSRRAHKWHFWLDAGSPLWLSGGAATLFGAPLFLQSQLGRPWETEDETVADQQRLQRILVDLLSRCWVLYLCHSELAVNGQEQTGPLVPLIQSAVSCQQSAIRHSAFGIQHST